MVSFSQTLRKIPPTPCFLLNTHLFYESGFKDTSGNEVELVNGTSVQKAIRKYKEIVPVLLVPFNAIQDIRNGAKPLVKLLEFFEKLEDCLEHLHIWFTHAKGKNMDDVKNIVLKTYDEMEQNDPNAIKLLEFILSEVTNGHRVKIFNPLDNFADYLKLLEGLRDAKHLSSTSFKYKTCDSSRRELRVSVKTIKDKCGERLRQQNFGRVFLEIELLERLIPHFSETEPEIEKYLKEIVSLSIQHLKDICKEAEEKVQVSLSLKNELTEEMLDFVERHFQLLEKASVLETKLKTNNFLPSVFFEWLQERVKEIQHFVNTLNDFFQVAAALGKLKMIQNRSEKPCFQHLQTSFSDSLKEVNNKLLKILSIEEEQDFGVICSSLDHFLEAQKHLSTFFSEEDLKARYNKAVEQSSNKMIGLVKSLCAELEKDIDHENISTISSRLKKLREEASGKIQRHVKEAPEHLQVFIDAAVKKCLEIIEFFTKALKDDNETLKEMKKDSSKLRSLSLLKDVDVNIQSAVAGKFYELKNLMEKKARELTKASEVLEKIGQDNEEISVVSINKNLDTLKNASWIESVVGKVVSTIYNDACDTLKNTASHLRSKILSSWKMKKPEKVVRQLLQMEQLCSMRSHVPKLEELLNQTKEALSEEVEKTLELMRSPFEVKNPQKRKSPFTLESELAFLRKTAECFEEIEMSEKVKETIQIIEQETDDHLEKLSKNVSKLLKDMFKEEQMASSTDLDLVWKIRNDLQTIKSYTKFFKESAENFFAQSVSQLKKTIIGIQEEFPSLVSRGNHAKWNHSLRVLGSLIDLDFFLNEKASEVYRECNKLVSDSANKRNEIIDASLGDKSYDKLSNELEKMRKEDDKSFEFTSTISKVKQHLGKNYQKLKLMISSLHHSETKLASEISTEIDNFEIAALHLSVFYPTSNSTDEQSPYKGRSFNLDNMLEELRSLLEKRLNDEFQKFKKNITSMKIDAESFKNFNTFLVNFKDLPPSLSDSFEKFKEEFEGEREKKLTKDIEEAFNEDTLVVDINGVNETLSKAKDESKLFKHVSGVVFQLIKKRMNGIVENGVKCSQCDQSCHDLDLLRDILESLDDSQLKQRTRQIFEQSKKHLEGEKGKNLKAINFNFKEGNHQAIAQIIKSASKDKDYEISMVKEVEKNVEERLKAMEDCVKNEQWLSIKKDDVLSVFGTNETLREYLDESLINRIEVFQTSIGTYMNRVIENLQKDPPTCTQQEISFLILFEQIVKTKFSSHLPDLSRRIEDIINSCERSLNALEFDSLLEPLQKLGKYQIVVTSLKRLKFSNEHSYDSEKKKLVEICIRESADIGKFTQKVKEKVDGEVSYMKELWSQKQYSLMEKKVKQLNTIQALRKFFPEMVNAFKESLGKLKEEAQKCGEKAKKQISSVLECEGTLLASKEDELRNINSDLEKLACMADCLKEVDPSFEDLKQSTINLIESKISKKTEAAKSLKDAPSRAESLVSIQRIGANINIAFEICKKAIQEIVTRYRDVSKDSIFVLGVQLDNASFSPYGGEIVSQHEAFRGISIEMFTTVTGKQNIDYALEKLEKQAEGINKSDDFNRESIRSAYESYEKTFNQLFKEFLNPQKDRKEIIERCVKLTNKLGVSLGNWSPKVKESIPSLLGHVFAFWSLENSDLDYYRMSENKAIKKPHAVQVVSILRLFGIDANVPKNFLSKAANYVGFHSQLENHLIQIGTGEGKSITLAAASILLSLFGFSVDCVCYSKYLSQRDFDDFKELFKQFGVLNGIRYGTVKELCELTLAEKGDIREQAKSFIEGKPLSKVPASKRPKVLLIDETDVFFSGDFLGKTFNPITLISTPQAKALVEYVWTSTVKSLREVKMCQAYLNLLPSFRGFEWILETEVSRMLLDKKDIESPPYFVYNGKIGYQEFDDISTKKTFGYKTQFAYIKEHQGGQIKKEVKEENIGISILCGRFSYAEIPKQYELILGVTGTLEKLSGTRKNIIEDIYKIKKKSFMPSIFGERNFEFRQTADFQVIKEEANWFQKIQKSVAEKIKQERAVLVFFDVDKEDGNVQKGKRKEVDPLKCYKSLLKFKNEYCSSFNKVNELTPYTKEKQAAVRKATVGGTVTILTKEFGRGTDFITKDQKVIEKGGLCSNRRSIFLSFSEPSLFFFF